MTKKDFKERVSVHNYGRSRDSRLIAIFFDWKTGDINGKYFGGFKYCVFARGCNAKQNELFNMLYDIVTERIEDTPWYIQLIVAQTDEQRFKVPLSSSGLNCMIKR
jgi:hypothetical protein